MFDWFKLEAQAKAKLPMAVELDLDGPPCSGCKHWYPVAKTDDRGNYDGVKLCHAEQFQDFSCFEDRTEVPK